MPEGHTVHRLANLIGELFGNTAVAASSPQGRFDAGAATINGHVLEGAEAHGKHMFAQFDTGQWLRVHLGLYGSWMFDTDDDVVSPEVVGAPRKRIGESDTVPEDDTGEDADAMRIWQPREPRGAVRLRLVNAHAVADLSGPAACELILPEEKAVVHARLGPDPLHNDTDPEPFINAVRASRRTIGELLMDQKVIAGIGNIYRAEALFRARVHPRREGRSLAARTVRKIWDDVVVLMNDGLRSGIIITTEPEDRPDGHIPDQWAAAAERASGEESDQRWYVYHRTGRPCLRCGRPVAQDVMAGRQLYWCPRCQRRR